VVKARQLFTLPTERFSVNDAHSYYVMRNGMGARRSCLRQAADQRRRHLQRVPHFG
jgi:hypothetical protein